MPYVYLLECADGTIYVGSTRRPLETRLEQHASGRGAIYTSTRLPVTPIFAEEFASVADAYAIERKLHGWSNAKKRALARGDWPLVKLLARRGGVGTPRDGASRLLGDQ